MGRPRLTTEEVVEKFKEVHGADYDYSEVVYTYARNPVVIICPSHGRFVKAAHSHLQGSRCRLCRNEKYSRDYKRTADEFIAEASLVHGELYQYHSVNYVGYTEPVTIVCSIHGDFLQKPSHHLRGSGCPSCARCRFDMDSPATLYVLKAGDFTKVGITNGDLVGRLSRVRRSSGRDFKLVRELQFERGSQASDREKQLLAVLRRLYKSPSYRFEGWTETFIAVDAAQLNKELEYEG